MGACGGGGRQPGARVQGGRWLSHQLVVADGQVGHLAPVDEDHIKTALWLPAVDTQRVLAATVQAAAIGVEEDAPGPGERRPWVRSLRRGCGKPRTRAEVETGKGHRSHAPRPEATPQGPEEAPPTARLPDRPRLPFDTAHHLEFLQIPETDGPAEKVRPHAGFYSGQWLGRPAFLQTLAHPPPGQGYS